MPISPLARAQTSTVRTSPNISGSVRDVRLLESGVGWVLAGNRLLLTRTSGNAWEDITPQWRPGVALDGVYFLDARTGWVLLHDSAQPDPQLQLQVASTSDSGRTWTLTGFSVGSADQLINYSGVSRLEFIDAQHGWMLLRERTSSSFSHGMLFASSDGGHTWTELPRPPLGDPFHFTSLSEGWLAGGPTGRELFATRDGGMHWTAIAVPQPKGLGIVKAVRYELPSLGSSGEGRLVARYQTVDKTFSSDTIRWTAGEPGAREHS
jgi:photosystem II stability/assembly factor-like uncharacterized protein